MASSPSLAGSVLVVGPDFADTTDVCVRIDAALSAWALSLVADWDNAGCDCAACDLDQDAESFRAGISSYSSLSFPTSSWSSWILASF